MADTRPGEQAESGDTRSAGLVVPPRDPSLAEEAELLLLAVLPLLPLRGSWNTGYEVATEFDVVLCATLGEWGTAAYHAAELHKALRAAEVQGGTPETAEPSTPESAAGRMADRPGEADAALYVCIRDLEAERDYHLAAFDAAAEAIQAQGGR